MIAPTRQHLDQISAFRLHDVHVAALTGGEDAFERFGVTTPLRMAHFLAQVFTETTGLSALRENLTYTSPERIRAVFGSSRFPTLESAEAFVQRPQALAEKVYGGRLGNTADGDGWRYRGGGLIQLTGRDNYRIHGRLAGLPLEDQPDMIEQSGPSLIAALSYWKSLDINTWADRDDVLAVSRAVNRGNPTSSGEPHGLNDRIEYLRRAKRVLAVPPGAAPSDELTIGDRGEAVRALQEDLVHLTYLLGAVDGEFGLQTHRAVKLFEEEHGLAIDGVFTGADRAVLEAVKNQPVRIAEDREQALREHEQEQARQAAEQQARRAAEDDAPVEQPDTPDDIPPGTEARKQAGPHTGDTPIGGTGSMADPRPGPMDVPTTHRPDGGSGGLFDLIKRLLGRRL